MSFFAACGMLERTSWISLPAFPRLRKAHCFECHSFHRNEVMTAPFESIEVSENKEHRASSRLPCCLLSIAVLFMGIQRALACLMSPTCVCRQASTSSKDCGLEIVVRIFPTRFLANQVQRTLIFQVGLGQVRGFGGCARDKGGKRWRIDLFFGVIHQPSYAEAECNRATGWMAGMQLGHRLKLSDQPLTKHHMKPKTSTQLTALKTLENVFFSEFYILIYPPKPGL